MAPSQGQTSATEVATEPIHELKLGISGYIAEMTKDLKGLATNAEFEFLAYLLSVAEEEARGIHRTMRSRLASATADFEFSPSPDDA